MKKKKSTARPASHASAGRRTSSAPRRSPTEKKRATSARNSSRIAQKVSPISLPELHKLQDRLREAEETIQAIRSGEVDAVVVTGTKGNKIYSLAGAEQPYRVYVERMQEGAVTVSADAMILFCNQRFSEMLQVPLGRAISGDLKTFIPPNSWEIIAQVLQSDEEVVKHETRLLCGGLSELPVMVTASRLPLENQEVICLVVSDISAQKERAELRLAKDLAEKANLAKDSFLAALSHELRTPLTPALMVAAQLEMDASLAPELRKQLTTIRRNVELEARLIDDLLDLTRIARGKLELHLVPMDVHHALRNAIEICQPDIDAKHQTLQLSLGAEQTEINGDPVRIQQVLWNLIRNAAKFTPPGGKISVSTANYDAGIGIEISDTGIGFDAEAEPRLFRAFEQGSRQITQQFGGLGLGLTISRSIAEAHHGRIFARSEGSGRGSTFTVELPIEKSARSSGPYPEPPAKNVKGSNLRILLVEDHHDTRAHMELLLRTSQHQVTAAASAGEAISAAENAAFDLVISDLGLPDQSGLEMMRTLRDRFGLTGIAVSGYGMEEDLLQSRAAGFAHHLTKPIAFDRLRQLIAQMSAADSAP